MNIDIGHYITHFVLQLPDGLQLAYVPMHLKQGVNYILNYTMVRDRLPW